MKDDIETLRRIIKCHVMDGSPVQREAIAALERLEKERREYDGTILHLEAVTKSLASAEAERDSLRANLERAKEALSELMSFANIYDMGDEPMLLGATLEKCSAVLAELSADAPAQQTQISDGPEVTKPEGLE